MSLFNLDTIDPAEKVGEAIQSTLHVDSPSALWDKLIEFCIGAGEKILVALLILIVGKFIISLIKKVARRFLSSRDIEPGVKTFLMSLINIVLLVLLIVSVIGALGINTTSFAALIASAGVAIGMALSGNLQNFAGGIIILLFKPYKVGDFVECQSVTGTVREIQIFHTVIRTPDNKIVFVPNGSLSSGVITNINCQDTRRVEWIVAVEYGEDYTKVINTLKEIITSDERVLTDPEPFFAMKELADSSVNFVMRGWTNTADFWGVYFEINKKIYEVFNERGIGFPFPQLTIHQAGEGK